MNERMVCLTSIDIIIILLVHRPKLWPGMDTVSQAKGLLLYLEMEPEGMVTKLQGGRGGRWWWCYGGAAAADGVGDGVILIATITPSE